MRWDSLLGYGALLGAAGALDCSPEAIQSALPSNASLNFAYTLSANSSFQVPQGDTGYPVNPVQLPSLCAVSVQVQSVGNTTFGFGLFLPQSWNGRFLAVGNGGFAGGINWQDMVRQSFQGICTNAYKKHRDLVHATASRPCLQIPVTTHLVVMELGRIINPGESRIGVT